MPVISSWFKLITTRQLFRKPVFGVKCHCSPIKRTYADKTITDISKSIQVQGTDNEERIRVRRARPADAPRVLRFVREHAKSAWPDHLVPPSASHIVLCDYVSRALAQGHSMLAEQQESRRGWTKIRGLALGMAVCQWDTDMLEGWSHCIRCTKSKQLLQYIVHCLQAPALHEKYQVHNILQVIVIVPTDDCLRNSEIVHVLVKNVIQRAQDAGYKVLRFDVTNDSVAKALDEIHLQKECQIVYNTQSEEIKPQNADTEDTMKSKSEIIEDTPKTDEQHLTVYTAFTDKNLNK